MRILSVFANWLAPSKDWFGNDYVKPNLTWGESYETLLADGKARDDAFRKWAANTLNHLSARGYVVTETWSDPRDGANFCPVSTCLVGIESISPGDAMDLSLSSYDSLTRDRRDPVEWVVSGLQAYARIKAAQKRR